MVILESKRYNSDELQHLIDEQNKKIDILEEQILVEHWNKDKYKKMIEDKKKNKLYFEKYVCLILLIHKNLLIFILVL